MSLFLGTHQNRLDAKGRISIPASFRSTLRKYQKGGEDAFVILRPSHKLPCIEGWPPAIFAALAEPLEEIALFSEEHDDLATALYADAWPVEPDREGRIILPERLREYANLSESVIFMGLGKIFQIWEPEAASNRQRTARLNVKKTTLPNHTLKTERKDP